MGNRTADDDLTVQPFCDLLRPWRKGGTVLDILRTGHAEDVPEPVVEAYVHCLRRWGAADGVVVLGPAAAADLLRSAPRGLPPAGGAAWRRARAALLAARALAVPVRWPDRWALHVAYRCDGGDGVGGTWCVLIADPVEPGAAAPPLPGLLPYLDALVGPGTAVRAASAHSPPAAPGVGSVLQTLQNLERVCAPPDPAVRVDLAPDPAGVTLDDGRVRPLRPPDRVRLWAALSRIAAVAAAAGGSGGGPPPGALAAAVDAERNVLCVRCPQ